MPDDSARTAAGNPPTPETDSEPMGAPPTPNPTAPPPTVAPKLAEILGPAIARLRRRHTGEERPIPLPWPTVAEPLGGGLWPGLHVFVGNTASGKTQWCLQVALHAAQKNTPVLYVALEADEEEFIARCFGLVAGPGTYWSQMFRGLDRGFDQIIADHTAALETLKLHIRFAPPYGWTATALAAEVQALRATYRETTPGDTPLLVILDFLQVVGAGDTHQDLRERIGRAAYVGRGVAREHNAAVLLASSTARENYLALFGRRRNAKKGGAVENESEKLGQGSPVRFLGVGKESGEIEYAADNVLVLTQEPWESDTMPDGGTICHLALAKVRAGVPDWVRPPLRFDGRAFSEPEPEKKTTVTA